MKRAFSHHHDCGKRRSRLCGGSAAQEGQLVTSGGRVLGVTAVADTLPEAVKEAYRLMDGVQFENRFFRRDIGAKALAALEGRS